MPRHSAEHALEDREFERLWKTTDDLQFPYDLECRFILAVAGRLGLRAGELSHLTEEWVDWQREMINVPRFEPCDCGYCYDHARRSAEATGVDVEKAFENMWSPKTPTSARAVPFGWNDRVVETLEEFFITFDEYARSRSSVNRRVDRLLEAAGYPQDYCFPHSLRATAATHLAYRGLPAPALQSMFGWRDISTAMKYIRLSGGATEQALDDLDK